MKTEQSNLSSFTYTYALSQKPGSGRICVLASDMEKAALALKGRSFGNIVTSHYLASREDIYSLIRSFSDELEISVSCNEVTALSCFAAAVSDYRKADFNKLEAMGF